MKFSSIGTYFNIFCQQRVERKKAKALLKLYQQLDGHITQFQDQSGLKCVNGCGKCCENPNIEVTLLDVLPLAEELWKKGEAESWLKKTQEVSGQGQCVFFKPDPLQVGNGRCSVYSFRPLVCRLFGFSAVLDKHSRPALVTCPIIKETCKTQVKNFEENPLGFNVPLMSDYAQKVLGMDPELGKHRMPINRAIQMMLEKIGLKRQFTHS